MSEEELEKLASERAEEETETVDDCDYDGCSRSCARDYYYFGFKDGYNKANEWHYMKDGDLPKENQLVLLYRENRNGANIALTYWYKSYVKDKVIAWKEIVLPKESK